jgi:hypothetical protein
MSRGSLNSEEFAISAIRIKVAGDWRVQEFASFMEDIRFIHDKLFTVAASGSLLRDELRRNKTLSESNRYDEIDEFWSSLFGEEQIHEEFPGFPLDMHNVLPVIESALEVHKTPMFIDKILVESPGWIQMIGNLNPLKVIADFISKWRAENTKRESIESNERIQLMKLEIEWVRIRQEYEMHMFDQLPKSRRSEAALRLAAFSEYAIRPSFERLDRVARDSRVLEATITTPGSPLSPDHTVLTATPSTISPSTSSVKRRSRLERGEV